MSRLSEKHRKIISISVVLITLIVMAGSFIYIAFKDPSVTQVVGKESSEARYVLVNEDDGWEFENKNYQLGRDFVTFISFSVFKSLLASTLLAANFLSCSLA